MKEVRAAFYADPEWYEKYSPGAQPLIETQETSTTNSPDFAPVYPVTVDIPADGTPEFIKKNTMVCDFRTYTFKPGSIPAYMSAAEEVAIPIRKRHGVKLAGWYYSEIGDLNQVTHIWAFDDLKHLKYAKDAVAADPEWTDTYIPRVSGMIVAQNTYLINTTEFGPVPA